MWMIYGIPIMRKHVSIEQLSFRRDLWNVKFWGQKLLIILEAVCSLGYCLLACTLSSVFPKQSLPEFGYRGVEAFGVLWETAGLLQESES